MTVGPSSNSGAGGLWQNPAYPVVNSTSLFEPNQTVGNFAGQTFQPTPQPGVPAIPLGGSGPQAALNVVQVSAFSAYEIAFNFSVGSPLVTGQVMQCDIYWWDQLGDSVPVEHIRWEMPVSAANGIANGFNTWGHGPMAGQWMAIAITNQTATGFPNGIMSFTGTTRNWGNHDWRSDGGLSNFAASSADPYTNELLAISNAGVPASSSTSRQILLYSGQALFHTSNQIATGTLTAVINDSAGHELIQLHPPVSGAADELIELPRRLCSIVITNTSGANAGTFSGAIIADRP
jgi:hypothetical protein